MDIRIKIECKLVIYILVLFSFSFNLNAAMPDVSELRQGWLLYKLDKFSQAAQIWQQNSFKFLNKKRNQQQLRMAALAQILATFSYEKNDDKLAYQAWATGQTYLLESNISWQEFSKQIKRTYEEELNSLNQASVQMKTGLSALEKLNQESTLLMFELEDVLSISDYQGPKPGLAIDHSQKKELPSFNQLPQRSYIPRPSIISDTEDKVLKNDYVENATSRGVRHSVEFEQQKISKEAEVDEKIQVTLLDQPVQFHELKITNAVQHIEGTQSVEIKNNKVPNKMTGYRGIETLNSIINLHDRNTAHKAWQYFKHNTDNKTGFVFDTHQYSYSSMWSIGSYIGALISVQRLGVISKIEFDVRATKLLSSLNAMPLYNDELPNRQYGTTTLSLIDTDNQVSSHGSGWTTVGTGRLLIWLKIMEQWYPAYKATIKHFINRLNFIRALQNEELTGSYYDGSEETLFIEGRFGYEQYAAMGYKLWGESVDNSLNYDTIIFKKRYQIDVPVDSRSGSHLVSDPFLLASMELSLINSDFQLFTQNIYEVQKFHSVEINKHVAQTEMNLNQFPWFVYHSIFDEFGFWQVTGNDGAPYSQLSGFSTHGIFMFDAVFSDNYSQSMMDDVKELQSDDFGFYSGKTYLGQIIKELSAHSNGVILQSLLYKHLNKPFLDIDNILKINSLSN